MSELFPNRRYVVECPSAQYGQITERTHKDRAPAVEVARVNSRHFSDVRVDVFDAGELVGAIHFKAGLITTTEADAR